MKNEKVMKFLHCFEIMYYKKVFGLSHYSLHTTHYTTVYATILINDINGLLCVLIFKIGDYYVQNTNYLVVLSETKDSTDEILNLCYPWVFTYGCQTPRSPRNTRNTGNLVEMEKFWVLCNMYGSIEYQIFPFYSQLFSPETCILDIHSYLILNIRWDKRQGIMVICPRAMMCEKLV